MCGGKHNGVANVSIRERIIYSFAEKAQDRIKRVSELSKGSAYNPHLLAAGRILSTLTHGKVTVRQ